MLLAIHSGHFHIVSDGSFDPLTNIDTTSCVIWDGSHWDHITFAVPGMPEAQCAYCSELAGLYCQLWFRILLSKYHEISDTTFTTIRDCERALTAVYKERCNWDTKHQDFISGCLSAITRRSTRGIKFIPQHVYGHQNTKNPLAELTLAAQLNEYADNMAGDYRYIITHQGSLHVLPLAVIIWCATRNGIILYVLDARNLKTTPMYGAVSILTQSCSVNGNLENLRFKWTTIRTPICTV